jgi:hypothetical protein
MNGKTLKIVKMSKLTEEHWEAFRENLAPNCSGTVIEFVKLLTFDENGERNNVSLSDANSFRREITAEYYRLRDTEFLRASKGSGLPRT